MWSFLAGFYFFSTVIFAWIKICSCACFGAILEDWKCFKLLFILNVHILRSEDGCFTITPAPKLKVLLFYQNKDFLLRIIKFWRPEPIPQPPTPPTHPHPIKWTINLLFKNNRICKHAICPPPNFKTSPPPTNVIDAWSLIRSIFQKCERRDRILQSLNLLFLSATTFFKYLIFDSTAKETYLKTQSKVYGGAFLQK